MVSKCYFYNPKSSEFEQITIHDLEYLYKNDLVNCNVVRRNLYLKKNSDIPMVAVLEGNREHGFRLKPDFIGNTTISYRGNKESLTHLGNKEAIAELEEFTIRFNNDTVKLFIDYAEQEKQVTCNNKKYIVDIYFKLKRTEPKHYFEEWNGEIFFEIYHTCKVDYPQSEDFAIEHYPLFEYRVYDYYNFDLCRSKEGFEKRKAFVKDSYMKNELRGILIFPNHNGCRYEWRDSKIVNKTTTICGTIYTVFPIGNNKWAIRYSHNEKTITKYRYCGNEFTSQESAIKAAERLAFMRFNGNIINKDFK